MKKPIDVAAMFPEVGQIADADLRAKINAVWEHLWELSAWEDVEQLPTAPDVSCPHLRHNRAVLAIALDIADAFERFHGVRLNRDHLIAAAVLMDASKILEYSPDAEGRAEATEIGKTYPHSFWAAHVAIEKGIPTPIVNIILSHTAKSPKFPPSLEGKILYYVDQLDMIAISKDRWRKELYVTM